MMQAAREGHYDVVKILLERAGLLIFDAFSAKLSDFSPALSKAAQIRQFVTCLASMRWVLRLAADTIK